MAEIAHRFVTTNGIKMHYAEAGSGPRVLLCHGAPDPGIRGGINFGLLPKRVSTLSRPTCVVMRPNSRKRSRPTISFN